MSAIEQATAHYQAVGLRRIDVPEWGAKAKPFLVFSTPMTIYERRKCAPASIAGDLEMYVSALILKATDKNGNKHFTEDDRHALLCKVDGAIVTRIALQIFAGPSTEELEKN